MIALVSDKREEIAALCRQYTIRKLELFGSATGPDFNPETSDLDFIVDLGEYERGVGKRFLRFCNALEALMGRSVDVITIRQIHNPYFRASVNATREVIYDASDGEAVA
jgi:predicted nucleotidyltransferase